MKARIIVTLLFVTGIVPALMLIAGLAQAVEFNPEDHDGMKRTNQSVLQLSKRPYVAPFNGEVVEGATVVEEEKQKPNKLNLHMLGRKPYASQE